MNAPCICPECGQAIPSALGIVFDRETGLVARGGMEVRLTPYAAAIFRCLLERYPRVQSKLDLWDWVYDGGFLGDPEVKIVDVWVCKIRPLIEPLGIGIETIWGLGYRLTGDMEKAKTNRREPLSDEQKTEIKERWGNLETDHQIGATMGLAHFKVGYERRKMGLIRSVSRTFALRRSADA